MSALDADVLIYAAEPGHPLGGRVLGLVARADDEESGEVLIGSVLLMPEVLAKPLRADPLSAESQMVTSLLSRVHLLPCDESTARLALGLAVTHHLRAADSVHLATAVLAGADRFLTNNRRDFPKSIGDIEVVYPDELPSLG